MYVTLPNTDDEPVEDALRLSLALQVVQLFLPYLRILLRTVRGLFAVAARRLQWLLNELFLAPSLLPSLGGGLNLLS